MNDYIYGVSERIFMLDCGRKYFTPEWIKRLIDEISAVGFNAINIHFADDMAFRLESKEYPWLAGGDHLLCGFGPQYGCPENDGKYITQEEMKDIVLHARSRGVDVIPSLDSPGHMTYIVKTYKQNCGSDIGNYYHKNGKVALVQAAGEREESSFSLYSSCLDISNTEALSFITNLYTELGSFFRELGCKSFDIGGDELLGWGKGGIDTTVPKWCNLDHWKEYAQKATGNSEAVAYDAFILYMNDIASLLHSLGYESVRMWNDDVYRASDTDWKEAAQIDTSIAIQYWSPHTNGGNNTAQFYIDRGHDIYNYSRLYSYYTLYPELKPSYVTPEAIMEEWNPYVFAPNNSSCDTHNNGYIFPPFKQGNIVSAPNKKVKGIGFCLWTDTPSAETEDALLEHIRPYITAIAKKATGNF